MFRGDRLPLQCTASYLEPSAQLHWSHNGRAVATHEERAIYLEDTLLHDCCLLTRYRGAEQGGGSTVWIYKCMHAHTIHAF